MTVTMIILYGIQGAYQPAVKASIPVLVGKDNFMRANSVVDMINSVAGMAGPVLGGLLFSFFGLIPVLFVSTGCFLVFAGMEMFIHIPFEKMKTPGSLLATGLNDLKESFSFMFKKRTMLWKVSFLFASSNLLLTSLILIALPVLITQHLNFPPDTAGLLYGYSQGVIAGGAVLGGFLAGILANKLKPQLSPFLLLGSCMCILVCGAGLQILNTSMGIYILLLIGCGLFLTLQTLFQIQMMTLLQVLTPGNLIGKVIACFMCMVMCTTPLGQFLFGVVFEYIIGTHSYLPFYIAGGVMIGITILTRRIFNGVNF